MAQGEMYGWKLTTEVGKGLTAIGVTHRNLRRVSRSQWWVLHWEETQVSFCFRRIILGVVEGKVRLYLGDLRNTRGGGMQV
jgi:hypothetical protein